MPETQYLNPKTGAHPFEWQPPERLPNIFLISIDMVPPEFYRSDSPYAAHLRLPHLRRLFAESVTYVNAFSVSPLCGPSRASYLTGRYPYLTVNEERAHDGHAYELRADDAIFPEYLKAVGYHTRHVGKGHVGTELFLRAFGENDAAWNRWAPPIRDDDAYLAYLRGLGVRPLRWHEQVRGLAPDRRTPGNSYGGWVEQENGAPFPIAATYPHYLAHRALETLCSAREQTGKHPIYLQLDFFAPHQPFMIPAEFAERRAALEAGVQLPESYLAAQARDFAPAADEPRIYAVYRRNWGLYDPAVARRYILANLLQMEVLDAAIGRFVDELQQQGLYDDALILFLADHGEMNGERALIDKGVYGHPKVARVPMAVKWPAGSTIPQAPSLRDGIVSLLDVAPTLLGAAGIRPLARLDGRALQTTAENSERNLLFETHWHVAPNPAVSLLRELAPGHAYMYTYNLTSEVDELYDLADPGYRNRAADPELAAIRQEMIAELGRVLSADPRWRCYWHPLRLDRYAELGLRRLDTQLLSK